MRIALSQSGKIVLVLLAAALVCLAWWLWPTEKRRVAQAIRRIERAAEAGDWQGLMAGVSKRYRHDGLRYDGLASAVEWMSKQVDAVDIYVLRKRITVQGNLATANLNLVASSSGPNARFAGTDRFVWQVSFRRENGQWLVYKINPVGVSAGRRRVNSVKELLQWMGG